MSIDADQQLDALLAVHASALARLAASYAPAAGERDDPFQEIVIAIWKALPRFRGECSERTFAFRIAHNRGIAYAARRRLTTTDPVIISWPALLLWLVTALLTVVALRHARDCVANSTSCCTCGAS